MEKSFEGVVVEQPAGGAGGGESDGFDREVLHGLCHRPAGAGPVSVPPRRQRGETLIAAAPEHRPGTYVLVLEVDEARSIRVGRLGDFPFPAGWYCYVGSAFGPGGVAARCGHHRRVGHRPHWHIDYLRVHCRLREIWYTHDSRPCEHRWAQCLGRIRGAQRPVPGFGASDCGCPSHLWHFRRRPGWRGFRDRMKLPGRPGLKREIIATGDVLRV